MDVNHGEKLKSLGRTTSQLDAASEESIQRFKEQYGDRPLDLLLNVAGTNAMESGKDQRDAGWMVAKKARKEEWRTRTTTHSPP